MVKAFDGLDDPTPTTVIDLRTDTMNVSDRGLLGLAVDPGWPARPYVYVLYARDADVGGVSPKYGTAGTDADPCPNATAGCVISGRLARLRLDPATDLPVGNPTVLSTAGASSSPATRSGDLRFGPDGMLYASAGEGASFKYADYGQTGNPCGDPANEGGALRAQDIRSTSDPLGYSGAVIRISPDGGHARHRGLRLSQSVPLRGAPRDERAVGGRRGLERLGGARSDRRARRLPGQLRLAVLRGRRAPDPTTTL